MTTKLGALDESVRTHEGNAEAHRTRWRCWWSSLPAAQDSTDEVPLDWQQVYIGTHSSQKQHIGLSWAWECVSPSIHACELKPHSRLVESFPPDNHRSRILNRKKHKGLRSQPKSKWKCQEETKQNTGQNIHQKTVNTGQRKLAAWVVGVLHKLICSQTPYLLPPDTFLIID